MAYCENVASNRKGKNMERTSSSESRAGSHGDASLFSARNESNSSGVSWAVTASLGLILLALGTGLGLSSVSLWANNGASAATIGTAAILWLILMEVISSSMGGYLAGRLRTKWTSIHSDEVYFRDTAHGFLAWSVALVVTAAFLGSAGASLMGRSMTSAAVSGNVGCSRSVDDSSNPNAYFTGLMFRSDAARPESDSASARGEAAGILTKSLREGALSKSDQDYLAQLVATKTGLNQSDAAKRVSDDFASALAAAEKARKAVAHSLLWAFLSLLIGAFCASLAATIGGRQRDNVVIV
jgi:hypothetical protein